MATLFNLLKDKHWSQVPLPSPNLISNTTVIVTGGSSGLGLEAARHYVSLGAKTVVLAVRSEAKGVIARNSIESSTQRHGVVQVWSLDYDSYASIVAFVKRVNDELPVVNTVVLNAGVFAGRYEKSREGWESSLQVNVFSTALLGLLLLPKLKASGKTNAIADGTSGTAQFPHLTIVGSHTHATLKHLQQQDAPNVLAALSTPEAFNMQQYSISKLFDQYITMELADIVSKESIDGIPTVVINSVSPGACQSDLSRAYVKWYQKLLVVVFLKIFATSTEKGSRALVIASVQGRECHGKYWRRGEIAVLVILCCISSRMISDLLYASRPGPLVTSDEGKIFRKRVWGEIVEELRAKVPDVQTVV